MEKKINQSPTTHKNSSEGVLYIYNKKNLKITYGTKDFIRSVYCSGPPPLSEEGGMISKHLGSVFKGRIRGKGRKKGKREKGKKGKREKGKEKEKKGREKKRKKGREKGKQGKGKRKEGKREEKRKENSKI